MSAPIPDNQKQIRAQMDAPQYAPSAGSAERGRISISHASTSTNSKSTDLTKSEESEHERSTPSISTRASNRMSAGHVRSASGEASDGSTDSRVARHCEEKHLIGQVEALFLMLKTELGLGMVTIPLIFTELGLVGGILALTGVRAINFACGYMIGKFTINNNQVSGIGDVGRLVFKKYGTVGFWLVQTVFYAFLIFVTASIMLAIADNLGALVGHPCTAIYLPAALVITFLGSSIPSLGRITWIAYLRVASITAAVATFTGVLVANGGPITVPQTGDWHSDWHPFVFSSPSATFAALATTLFANSGTPAFFSIMAKMREPRNYMHSLYLCHGIMVALYFTIGIVVYLFSGSHISLSLFASLHPNSEKICLGLALVGLIPSAVLLSHIPVKDCFIRTQGTPQVSLKKKSLTLKWLGYTLAFTIAEYIIANVIPVFNELVSLIGAILGPLLILHLTGAMWIYDNWSREQKGPSWFVGAILSISAITVGTVLLGLGSYGSGTELVRAFHSGAKVKPFTCPAQSGTTVDKALLQGFLEIFSQAAISN